MCLRGKETGGEEAKMKGTKWRWRCPNGSFWTAAFMLVLTVVTVSSDEEASGWMTTTTTDLGDWETQDHLFPVETTSTSGSSELSVDNSNKGNVTVLRNDAPKAPEHVFEFSKPVYNATIPENSPWKTNVLPDERMGIQVWEDMGIEKIRYKIINGDKDKFFKVEELLVGDFCFLVVRTRMNMNDVLNRERKDKYVIDVRATGSNGKKSVEANTTVVIHILDINDLKPLFFQSEYQSVVPEDMPLHKSILQVLAEDADLGKNGEVYYSFLERTEQFSIHPTTGIVSLTRPLRYHEKSMYELTIVGQDRGYSPRGISSRQSTAKLSIRVKEVNIYVPEIYVQILTDVEENANFRVAAFVRVIDSDTGIHGIVKSLDIVDGDPDGHFRIKKIDEGEYSIELLDCINRDNHARIYNLTLRAVDAGVPAKQSYKSVLLKIAGVNDNIPVFDREVYEVNIPETSPINSPVIRLKVTDADESKNARVFLEIVGGNEGSEFDLNAETGMLYTAATLDAEEKSFYTLTVSAIDQGTTIGRKQSSAKVKINVVDMNDNDPTFDTDEMSVVVDENEPAGTTVLRVTAKDRDSGENSYISYSIANLNPVPFEIDHFSGVIRTTQVLDYESMRRDYVLRVRASDWGLPYRRQTEMQVKIRLKDVNDNRPQFEKVDCVGHVPRYVPIGTEILTLSAIDFDASNIISYRIVSGNEDNCFALDTTSGVLSVTCDLMDVQVSERMVNVTATDGTHFADVNRVQMYLVTAKRNLPGNGRIVTLDGGAFECRDTGVARRLTEVLAAAERNNMPMQHQEEFAMMPSRYGENVHSPEFIGFPLEIRVNESAPLGTKLATIQARDRDLGYNGKLVFGISSGDQDSVFRVDPDTGELKVIGYLDRERVDEYLLNISVYDLGKPQKSSSKILPVTVLDVNDNAPVFEKSVASFRIPENEANGTVIFRVNATDKDLGDNGMVSYSLVTDTNDFSVDPVQGILYVSGQLDRERQETYELKIRATDGGGKDTGKPPLFTDAVVQVHIEDVNDNRPTFALSTYTVRVREDIPIGSTVAIVSASDPDLREGGEVRYSLSMESDAEGMFSIDKQSGTIRTAKELNFEVRQVHSLVVKARDRGSPPLYAETNVIIEVVDVNENLHPPLFPDFVLSCTVKENLPIGSHVTTVTAVDNDPSGDDSKVSYSIRGGDGLGYFTIDEKGK
ncbi:hypothetical protein RUM43_006598 [Polyplax serrata]|uniref:Cadherin domain-containing protein n=1 Tax=Polyplax serrata TaxID=468196 RepID=A0AAN8RVI5_POLSC